MKRAVIAVLAAVLLAACGPRLSEFQASCEQRHSSFPSMARCLSSDVRAEVARRPGLNNEDLALVYAAWMGAAAERVEAGNMTDAEARLGAAELYSRLKSQMTGRSHAAGADYSRRYGDFLAGLAVFQQSLNPAPARATITCVPVGGGVVSCY